MKNLCIIPARAGSKRLPGKNTRDFFGRPVIAYSIAAAIESGCFDEVMVSTDSIATAGIARSAAAAVPFMRSPDAAADDATDADVIREVRFHYACIGKRFDNVCCLYPCAPLVTSAALRSGLVQLNHGYDSVVPIFADGRDPGQWYWFRASAFDALGSPPCGDCEKIIVPEGDAQDVNTESDWRELERKYLARSVWRDKSVLITGGTGSFGRRCVEILRAEKGPRRIIVFSRDELKQHEMRASGLDDPSLRYFLGDVRDLERLRRAMRGVDVVIHAAALKQVPACEYNPAEAVATNVVGTRNVVDAAIDCGVQRVLGLSTDKAVNPINLYGATKLCAEKLLVQGNSYAAAGGTRLACTRYGNVCGSRGSVVTVWRRQREAGTVDITHPEMTRFWLTLDQAVRFALQSAERMHGGEIFVPRIPSLWIRDLAAAVAPGCALRTTGIRPGEKLHETLVSDDEGRHTVSLPDFYVVRPEFPWWGEANWKEAAAVAPGFSYSSDRNNDWLSARAIADICGEECPHE